MLIRTELHENSIYRKRLCIMYSYLREALFAAFIVNTAVMHAADVIIDDTDEAALQLEVFKFHRDTSDRP